MTDRETVELGAVQRTLFFPLTARARETQRKRPLLRDPKAVEIVRALDFDAATYKVTLNTTFVVLRTMILDWWVRQFLDNHPAGTVVELGTGLNTRFERTDNGTVHWVDLDLPDTIEVRRRFFQDTGRRRMIAASLLDEDWLTSVERLPGPYFFVSDGVLVYLQEEEVTSALARIAARFPGAVLAFDTYPQRHSNGSIRWPRSGTCRSGSGRVTTRGLLSGSACGWPSPRRSSGRPRGSAPSCRPGTGSCSQWLPR